MEGGRDRNQTSLNMPCVLDTNIFLLNFKKQALKAKSNKKPVNLCSISTKRNH